MLTDNILACYPFVIKRLTQVQGIKKVEQAQDLSQLSNKKQRPDDGTLYVVFDGFTPLSDNNDRAEQFLQIGFSLILAKRNYTIKPNTDDVGQTLTNIMLAMQGYAPTNCHGDYLTIEPFKQANPLPIRYEDGYAFFSTRFITTVAITSDNNIEDL